MNATGDVTVSELLPAYNAFRASEDWQAVTVRQFESQVCDHLVSLHRAHKRTDIRRDDKSQRGSARVSLQEAGSVAQSPEQADAVDLEGHRRAVLDTFDHGQISPEGDPHA